MAVSKIADRRFKREKKKRTTRSEEYLVNVRYLGDEPQFLGDDVLTDLQLTKAYTWYSYMCSASDARDYIVEYMENIGKKNVAKLVKSIPDSRVPITAGWLCRIMSRGGKISDRSKEFLLDRVTRAIERTQSEVRDETQVKVKKPTVDVQASTRDKARDIIGNIESMIDKGEEFTLYEYMQRENIPPVYAGYIAEYYSKMVAELEEVVAGQDSDLKEAYRYTRRLARFEPVDFDRGIVDGASQFADNAKRVRKANRKPRTVSVEKIIKNLKFKKNDQEYKLVSIDPQQILAAQELWVFNTRNRMLTVYRAQDAGGLGVKNVRITGYNETTSISKKLRKPEETLPQVLSGGKPALRKLMDELTTKAGGFSDRLNLDTILLRVVK